MGMDDVERLLRDYSADDILAAAKKIGGQSNEIAKKDRLGSNVGSGSANDICSVLSDRGYVHKQTGAVIPEHWVRGRRKRHTIPNADGLPEAARREQRAPVDPDADDIHSEYPWESGGF